MYGSCAHLLRIMKLAHIIGVTGADEALAPLGVSTWIFAPYHWFATPDTTLRPGEKLRVALERMGPSFIKLGQALSTRSDIVGEAISHDLADLRDNLPPFSTTEARVILRQSFGKPVNDIFREFNDKPVAAASIAQVHQAVTVDGRAVAVKILRPGVREAFRKDLELFRWLAENLHYHYPELRRLKLPEVIRTFTVSVQQELDLRMEAANATLLKDNTKNDADFYVPAVDWALTTERVLTTEWVNATPISDVDTLRAHGHDLDRLIAVAAGTLFNQVFRDGFFHADLHPGNLFVRNDGVVVAVDFGIMGRIDKKNRYFVAEILYGFLAQDYDRVAKAHIDAGYVPAHHSVEDFAIACMAIGKPIIDKPLQDISLAELLGQLFRVSATYEMETQPQLLLLQKNMMLAEGVGRMLNPNVNMWELAKPLIEIWANEQLSLQGRATALAERARECVQRIPSLFQKLDHLLSMVDEQGIRLHPDSLIPLLEQRARQHRNWIWVVVIGLIILVCVKA